MPEPTMQPAHPGNGTMIKLERSCSMPTTLVVPRKATTHRSWLCPTSAYDPCPSIWRTFWRPGPALLQLVAEQMRAYHSANPASKGAQLDVAPTLTGAD